MSHSDWEHHSSLTVMANTYLILQQNIDVFCFGTGSFWSSVEKNNPAVGMDIKAIKVLNKCSVFLTDHDQS